MKYSIEKNERGILCASINGITLHSTRNPEREAASLIERGIQGDPPGVLVFGAGLGYHLEAIRRVDQKISIICIEPEAEWIDNAGSAGRDPRSYCDVLILCSEENWEERAYDYLHQDFQLLSLAPYRQIYPEISASLQALHYRNENRRQVNRNTLKRFGTRWVSNLIQNHLLHPQERGINRFIAAFSGLPALILAGGPSLTDVLSNLETLRRKMIIVAVDTAYLPCLREGVEPDFVLAVDPQYWNTKHIEASARTTPDEADRLQKRAVLVSESSAHPRSFRLLENEAVFSQSLFPLGRFFEAGLEPRIPLGSGGSVATTAWDFLRISGCTSIYAAGLDMGFPRRQTHFKGSYFEESIAYSGHRLEPCEQVSALYLYSGSLKRSENYRGEPMLSDRRMDVYCNWFELQSKNNPQLSTWSLNGQSRKISGFELSDCSELLELPDIRPEIDRRIQERMDIPVIDGGGPGSAEEDGVHNRLFTLKAFLKRLSRVCGEARKAIEESEHDSPDSASGLLAFLDETDKKILSEENRRIAGFLINDVTDSLATGKPAETLDEAIQRSDLLYQKLQESADSHMNLITRYENRFKFSPNASENK